MIDNPAPDVAKVQEWIDNPNFWINIKTIATLRKAQDALKINDLDEYEALIDMIHGYLRSKLRETISSNIIS